MDDDEDEDEDEGRKPSRVQPHTRDLFVKQLIFGRSGRSASFIKNSNELNCFFFPQKTPESQKRQRETEPPVFLRVVCRSGGDSEESSRSGGGPVRFTPQQPGERPHTHSCRRLKE